MEWNNCRPLGRDQRLQVSYFSLAHVLNTINYVVSEKHFCLSILVISENDNDIREVVS